jgi:UDP-N-acetylmuramoyl-tripeptide--D-alanyl-D-alanine ligase
MATPIPVNECAFRLDEVAAATGGELLGAPETIVRGVSIDTRTLGTGALFVALKGAEGRDGHAYLAEAAGRGAAAVLVARGQRPAGVAAVEVDDTLGALGDLARHHLRRTRATRALQCLAVGGAAGKTTTKELCAAVVGALFGETLATPGNLNNLIGVPMTIFLLGARHRAAVLECGTNMRGEIPRLARIVEPDVALVLNVDVEHSEGLGGLEEIADEEAALFATARRAVVACAEERLVMARIPRGAEVVTFGAGASCDVRVAARVPAAGGGRARVTLELSSRLLAAGTPARREVTRARRGAAAARNAAAAAAAAAALRARPLSADDLAAIAHALAGVVPVAGRLDARMLAGVLVIDDTYNANPRSVRAALEAAAESARASGARLVIALGDMLELGALSGPMHAGVVDDVARLGPAMFVAVGPEMSAAVAAARQARRRPSGAAVLTAPDSAAAAALVCEVVRAGDAVLVKGSRGLRMERIIEALGKKLEGRA